MSEQRRCLHDTHTMKSECHTFQALCQFAGDVWVVSEVEQPQVLSFTAQTVRGGRETAPRTRIAGGRRETVSEERT